MPCYQLILLARPDTTPDKLAALFRSVARVVYREHGQFRTLKNYGVRPLAFPIHKTGQKFTEVRWVQAEFDVAPAALASVGSVISSEKAVLQYKHLRATHELAEFRPSGRREKLKPFSIAMRYNAELFDPSTLSAHTHARGKTGDATPASVPAAPAADTSATSVHVPPAPPAPAPLQ